MLHVPLYGPAHGVGGEPADDGLGDAAGQNSQPNQTEKQVEPFAQDRCIAVAKEDVDTAEDPKRVRQTAQSPAEAVDDSALPLQAREQMETGPCNNTDQDPWHEANDETPDIAGRIEGREDKRYCGRGWRWHERPNQQAEQAGECTHGCPCARAQKDCCDDDGDHGKGRYDRPDRWKGAQRREADHSFDGKEHRKLCQDKSPVAERCVHEQPPCSVVAASWAQQLRPLLWYEEEAMSPCEITGVGDFTNSVARVWPGLESLLLDCIKRGISVLDGGPEWMDWGPCKIPEGE